MLGRVRTLGVGLLCGLTVVHALAADEGQQACAPAGSTLQVGFYASFAPVSYSADPDPSSAGFDVHQGYEADLLTALEAMEGANLTFHRRGIGAWDNIWLLPAEPPYDLVGGGITILESRTRDAAGRRVVVFTAGHVEFRQSLLVRAADARRLRRHRDLTGADRVGVLAGTTGEARLLELTGITGAGGVLAAGTRVETAVGEVVADGTGGYAIAAAGATAGLDGRIRLQPPGADQPPVVYLPDEAALLQALAAGEIDAVARGEAGNLVAARNAEGAFVVTALDVRVETGGFALAAADAELAACLDRHIAWLTDGGRIGYRQWHDERGIFLRRARMWSGPE